ncbi:organic hydroperoxide resistance protein [Zymobacter palmae]|uniref:Organic hydroperoxide resistance protein n=2 Tax=Zymobacter palmae TaxID=33074 RepID=A0A348HI47_9GAMM|nr:organic hydroperoxide resistance protein [Zymobacter palmae]
MRMDQQVTVVAWQQVVLNAWQDVDDALHDQTAERQCNPYLRTRAANSWPSRVRVWLTG